MDLKTYLAQEDPVRLQNGTVILEPTDIKVHGTIENTKLGLHITSVTVIVLKATYYVINGKGILWVQNEDGTPRCESVFTLAEPVYEMF